MTMLSSSFSQGSGAGWPGVSGRGPTWPIVQLPMSSNLHLLMLSDRSHCALIPGPPLPLVMISMWQEFVFPQTCKGDGAGWVAATYRVVMDTLCIRLGLICGPTLLFRHHSSSSSIVDGFKIN